MSAYIVAFTIRENGGFRDDYMVFIEDDAKSRAMDFYDLLLKREDLYCANVCSILKSTEHYEVRPARVKVNGVNK